jgi:serine/threonine protein kinase
MAAESSQLIQEHVAKCALCKSQVDAQRVIAPSQRSGPATTVPASYPSDPSLHTTLATSTASNAESPSASNTSPAAKVPKPLELPSELVDHPQYKVIKKIGRGGMGVLYLVEHRVTARQEALKIIHPHLLNNPGVKERFLREIQTAARLNHPNVVRTLTALSEGNLLGLVMEYAPGETLQRLVTRVGPLAVDRVLDFIAQATEGLVHADSQGMVHRDLKPANLMLTREADKLRLRILDFGLAKSTFDTAEQRQMTQTDSILGTPEYIAPEQALNPSKADIRADIYSLGCCMYFALTGVPPCQGETTLAILHAHLVGDVKPLSELRPELPRAITQLQQLMMDKSPEKRFQTPTDLLIAIRKCQKHVASLAANASSQTVSAVQAMPAVVNPAPLIKVPAESLAKAATPESVAPDSALSIEPSAPTATSPENTNDSKSDLFSALAATPSTTKSNVKLKPVKSASPKSSIVKMVPKKGTSSWLKKSVTIAGVKIPLPAVFAAGVSMSLMFAGVIAFLLSRETVSPDDAVIAIASLPADIEVFINGKKKQFQASKEGELIAFTAPGPTIISFHRAGKEVNKLQMRLAKRQRIPIRPNLDPSQLAWPTMGSNEPLPTAAPPTEPMEPVSAPPDPTPPATVDPSK